MDEAQLKQLPINDEFGQCIRKLRIMSPDITAKIKEAIRNFS